MPYKNTNPAAPKVKRLSNRWPNKNNKPHHKSSLSRLSEKDLRSVNSHAIVQLQVPMHAVLIKMHALVLSANKMIVILAYPFWKMQSKRHSV